jgi:hypothetical protein
MMNMCTLESKTLCSTSLAHFTRTFTDLIKAPVNIKELRETGEKTSSPSQTLLGKGRLVGFLWLHTTQGSALSVQYTVQVE